MKSFQELAVSVGFITEATILSEKSTTARPIAVGMTVTTQDGLGIVQSIKGKEAVVFIQVNKTKNEYPLNQIKFAGFRQGNKVKDKNGVLGGVCSVIGVTAYAGGKEDIIKVRDTDRAAVEIPEDDLIFVSGY